ncbi:hypothetical protein SH601_13085 [Gracilibacillus sp. S3-1-1]|uniref:Uncharacterized protein n=1 Tax=Gracilibacillus pellucidus TaxID=3095368 RepID=A0ACC6M7P3_9BACI|nr:hypothetical protein [Gracilibacillus sp. S3-1-1]MDX8046921.1 hypothetical protein [Gracilibacillus sp. S3-1-1]
MQGVHSFTNMLRTGNSNKTSDANSLRPGQMLRGQVLEIYPNQRAAIQLGGAQVVAQLETALSAKENYLFQVTSVGDVIHLKKVTESFTQPNRAAEQMMQQLGLQNNRPLTSFVQQLVHKQIPFTHNEVHSLATLLDKFGYNQTNRDVLMSMLTRNMPLTTATFTSMAAFQSFSLGEQINQLEQLLRLNNALQEQLSIFGKNDNVQSRSMVQQFVLNNHVQLEQLFTRLLPEQVSQLEQLGNRPLTPTQSSTFAQSLHQLLSQQLPFQIEESSAFESFVSRLNQLVAQGKETTTLKENVTNQTFFNKMMVTLPKSDQTLIQQWIEQSSSNARTDGQVLTILQRLNALQVPQSDQNMLRALLLHVNGTNPSSLPISDQFSHMMKHFIQTSGIKDEAQLASMAQSKSQTTNTVSTLLQSIMVEMSASDRQVVRQWLGNAQPSPAENQQIIKFIQRLNVSEGKVTDQQTIRHLQQLLTTVDQTATKEQLLNIMRQAIQQDTLIQGREVEQSLKQNLLAVSQQHPEVATQQIQRLIQAFTGLQLNMVPNNDQVISQQVYHIPGERFGLANDIQMQFEGKRRQGSEEIDPDFCKVLFHLDLQTLGETMIAMSIQKRIVYISVYNDHKDLKQVMDNFTPILKEKMSTLDFHLSSVTHKLISGEAKNDGRVKSANSSLDLVKNEGIDYRI